MECKKYEIIEDGGRKRIRSLRDFTVQDRHVCVGDLGGYVYDERTLGQRGDAWIFSGSLEMRDNARITGTGLVVINGDVELVGNFKLSAGSRTIYGKHRISSPDEANKPELPPTKKTW